MNGVNDNRTWGAGSRCPICKKPTVEAHRPFCSKRCADLDLQRWLTGGYAIPIVEEDDTVDDLSEGDDREL